MDLTSGVKALQGMRPSMEDTHCRCNVQNLNLYAVFDGHGGDQVAKQAAHLLPLMFAAVPGDVRSRLQAAITAVDERLCKETSAHVGSTALAAVVDHQFVYIANVGDSRGVLLNNDGIRFITRDHKADDATEAERIRAKGGHVFYNQQAHRVMGGLAMTRALGDHAFRSVGVTAEAETIRIDRLAGDDILILATDGLWDVMSNEQAALLVRTCMRKASDKGATRSAALRITAAVLTRTAIERRGSRDNVTVMVVDVQLPKQHFPMGASHLEKMPSLTLVPAISA